MIEKDFRWAPGEFSPYLRSLFSSILLTVAIYLSRHRSSKPSSIYLGVLLSSFFGTYTLCQLPVGWLIDRFDVTWILAMGFFLWSTATTISGLLHGFAALLIMRLILGIGESVAYPAYGKILAQHFPEHYRGTANTGFQLHSARAAAGANGLALSRGSEAMPQGTA